MKEKFNHEIRKIENYFIAEITFRLLILIYIVYTLPRARVDPTPELAVCLFVKS